METFSIEFILGEIDRALAPHYKNDPYRDIENGEQ